MTTTDNWTPVVEVVRDVTVVRDDLVQGGTKRAVLASVLPTLSERCFVFPASSTGMGQVALAIAGRDADKRVVLFVAARREMTRETKMAKSADAEIIECDNGRYNVVQARAREYAREHGAVYLPPGLNHPAFVKGVSARARSLEMTPERVVVTVSSGTLCRGLQRAWPNAVFVAVKVGMRPVLDPGAVVVVTAPEEYADAAQKPPPFPSARDQDAKAWRFCDPGSLFWNIAGNVR